MKARAVESKKRGGHSREVSLPSRYSPLRTIPDSFSRSNSKLRLKTRTLAEAPPKLSRRLSPSSRASHARHHGQNSILLGASRAESTPLLAVQAA